MTTIFVTTKNLGGKAELDRRPIAIPPPASLRRLIESMARLEAAEYNAGNRGGLDGEGGPPPLPEPLSSDAIEALAATGKIAFGLRYGADADPEKAVKTAISAVEDGLVRVFVNEEEAAGLDTPLALRDGDELLFLRLTFLSGG